MDGMLVHRRVTPSSKFAGTHLYTWVKRGTMRVKYLAQEHNAVPRPGLKPGPPVPESSALTIRPPRLPLERDLLQIKQISPNLFSNYVEFDLQVIGFSFDPTSKKLLHFDELNQVQSKCREIKCRGLTPIDLPSKQGILVFHLAQLHILSEHQPETKIYQQFTLAQLAVPIMAGHLTSF